MCMVYGLAKGRVDATRGGRGSLPRGDWCSATARWVAPRSLRLPVQARGSRHSPSAFSAGGDSSFGFGGGAFFFLGFFPMPICVGGGEARGRGRAGQWRAGKRKAAQAVEGAPSEGVEKNPIGTRSRRAEGSTRERARRASAHDRVTERNDARRGVPVAGRGSAGGAPRARCVRCPRQSPIA